jgi:hypothetical protein
MRNSIGSLRYDMYGRKRKTPALNKPRRPKADFKPMVHEQTLAEKMSAEHRTKYPSAEMSSTYTPNKDQSWKQEASKNFTVAPAYNKGAYQVIPRKDVEHIGR